MTTPDSKYILSIDLGTSSVRTLIFDAKGNSIFKAFETISLKRLDQYRVEQEPEEIILKTESVLKQAIEFAQSNQIVLSCAGLTTQRSTVVAWDKFSAKALGAALSWQDTRAHQLVSKLQKHSDLVYDRCGLPLSAHYGASKLYWLLNNNPQVKRAQQQGSLLLGPISSFLCFRLLKGSPHLVDHANAARTLLWNLETRDWDPKLLELFQIDKELLPSCCPIRHHYGILKHADIALNSVSGDQNAAAQGFAEIGEHEALINIGSGAFIMSNWSQTPNLTPPLLCSIIDSSAKHSYYVNEGTVNGAGLALSWAEKKWQVDFSDLQWIDSKRPPIFLNRVGGLGSPWWNSEQEPRLIGNSASHTAADLKAAVFESIAFLLRANLSVSQQNSVIKQVKIAGGLSQDSSFCQRLADLFELPVLRGKHSELSARGIAWLAAGKVKEWGLDSFERFEACQADDLKTRYDKFMKLLDNK